MNYFNETEKSLKRYLKSKVSITMATVVGFMIAGSVSFGAGMSQEEFNQMQETSYGKQFTTGETTLTNVTADGTKINHEKYMITVSSGAKLTIDGDSVISTNGTNKYALNITENSTVVNNGEIIFNPSGFSGKVAVQINGGAATSDKPATFINNNKIIGQNWLGNTIEMSGNSTLINSGIIAGNIVGSDYKGQAGTQVINLKKGSHIEGTIKLNGTGENLINIDGVKNETSETIDIQSKDVEVTINNSDVILTGNINNNDGTAISVNNKDGNNTIVNNATIVAETGIGVMNEGSDNSTTASDRLVSITNNGDITAKYYGIYNNGYFTKHNKIEIGNTGNILVNNFVKSESSGKPYYYATGIYQASGPYTKTAGIVRNDGGEVRVELTAEQSTELKNKYKETQGDMYLNIHGVRIHEHSEGYNTGDIIVKAFGGNGVVLSAGDTGANTVEGFKDRYNYFENAGNIVVEGENGIGLALKNTTEAKMEAINETNGNITVQGANVLGTKLVGKTEFTNNGRIELLGEETTGIGVNVGWGATFENNGTVENPNGTVVAASVKDGVNGDAISIVNNKLIVGETGVEVIDSNGTDNHLNSLVKITNEKSGVIKGKVYGIINNGYHVRSNGIEIENNGTIEITDYAKSGSVDSNGHLDPSGKPFYYANGIYQATSSYPDKLGKVTNNGTIAISLTSEQSNEIKQMDEEASKTNGMYINIDGIRLHGRSEGYNNGEIIVSNVYKGVGVRQSSEEAYRENEAKQNYFENNGLIEVSGEKSTGLVMSNRYAKDDGTLVNGVMEAINTKDGKIVVDGLEATGVRISLYSSGEEKYNSTKVNTTFTNNGLIELGTNTTNGIGILVEAGTATNNGIIKLGMNENGNTAIKNDGGTATNNGTLQVSDMTREEVLAAVSSKDEAEKYLFAETDVDNKGVIVDKNGIAIFEDEEAITGGIIDTDDLNAVEEKKGSVTIATGTDVKLVAGENPAELGVSNINGTITVIDPEKPVEVRPEVTNITATGKVVVAEEATLVIAGGVINKVTGESEDVTTYEEAIEANGTLVLKNMDIHGNIVGTGTVNVADGKTVFDGEIGVPSLVIGTVARSIANANSEGYFTADSKFTKETDITVANGQMTIEIADDLSNALVNSTANVAIDGNVGFDYSSLTKDTVVALAKDGINHDLANVNVVNDKESIYKVTVNDADDTAKFEYNKTLLEDNGYSSELNGINNGFQVIQDKVSQLAGTTQERAELADKVYAGTIYAETMKMAYDNTKLVEDSILSLETETKVGEWTANGKALYFKNKYDREGVLKDYSSESESTGLMATLEYGVNDTTSVGVAFAGVKQDLDTETGSADGDVFYLGAFTNKVLGNNRFTAGLGYQLDKFDADEKIFGGNEKYDSNAFTAYLQAKHIFDLGDNVSFEPKVKLGYTYIDQDEVKDGTYKVESQDMNVFDAEVGFDLVKSVALKSAKLDVTFGASYVRAMGDVDDNYSARFYNSTVEGSSFDVLGTELSEDTAKFDLGVEVSKDNGVFYNLGGTLKVGSDNTRNYGVKLGAGYRF